jgi:predicted CxxxxCH...CXXCH cytochrome family protein
MQNLPPVLNNTMEIGIPNQGLTGARYDGHVLNPPYKYLGTSGTVVTTNGTNICQNLYCHSNGTPKSTGVTSVTNFTPSWNAATGTPLPCNTCHGNTTYTDWKMAFPLYLSGQPKANSHVTHLVYTCNYCHYSTTDDGTSIRDHSRHANGDYGVAPDTTKTVTFSGVTATVNFTYAFDIGGGQCMNNTCHSARGRNPNLRWGEDVSSFSVTMLCNRGASCYEGVCSAQVIGGTNPPYTYSWNFGDGTNASSGTVNSISHIFPGSTQIYNVQANVRDASNALGTASYPFQPGTAPNQLPVAANTWTKNGYTVTITDLSYDRDYNTCGNSGPGLVTIWWTTNWITAETYQLNLIDQPSYQTFTHTYLSPGTYRIFYDVYDNKYNNGTGPRRVDFYVTVP